VGRFTRSFRLVKQSWSVLMQDKELLVLPVISGFFILLACASFFLPMQPWKEGALEGMSDTALALIAFAFYVVVYTISFFFQAALIAGASERMNGGDPTVGSALRAAGRRFGAILMWGVIAATVGMILRAIEDRSEGVGRFLVGLLGFAWSLATFFMVPVLVMEREGVGASFKRSGSLIKKTWGETVIGNLGLGLVGFLAMLLVGGIVYLLVQAGMGVAAVVAGVLLGALVMVFMTALNAVYVSALYRYATAGDAPQGFDRTVIENAFRRRDA
jgi:hypothetical protein